MASRGLYYNINKKRAEGRKMRNKGAKGAPTAADFKLAAKTAKKQPVKKALGGAVTVARVVGTKLAKKIKPKMGKIQTPGFSTKEMQKILDKELKK